MLPEDKAATAVVDASYLIHTTWGPGLLESACSIALEAELLERGHRVAREVRVPVVWNDVRVEDAFRIDLVVDDCLIVELKSVEQTARVHKKQVITYLELTGMRLGLLVNFGEKLIKDGITRLANGMPWTGRQRLCASAALRGNSVGAATDPPRTRQPLVIATPTNGGLNQPDHHVQLIPSDHGGRIFGPARLRSARHRGDGDVRIEPGMRERHPPSYESAPCTRRLVLCSAALSCKCSLA